MELSQLLKDHAVRQQKYTSFEHLSLAERQPLIRRLTSWIAEELIEVREAPNKEELGKEISDIFIYFMGLAAVTKYLEEDVSIESKLLDLSKILTEINRQTQEGDKSQRYKPFKESVELDKKQLKSLLKDFYMEWNSLVKIAGFGEEEIESIILEKLNYNNERKDHNPLRSSLIEMVAIPGGTFIMGSPQGEGHDDEKPQHQVTVQPFFMSKYPITQAQYQEIMGVNPARFQGDDQRPVEQVSWNDAAEFCKKLSKKTEKEYRLPTEAEWEYACRAGTTSPYYFGASITEQQANYDGKVGETTTVGSFPPNAFGLYDMHGNVWEWCEDDWHSDYANAPTDGTAWLSGESDTKVIRGGSWGYDPGLCRSAYRFNFFRDDRDSGFGFRVVCEEV